VGLYTPVAGQTLTGSFLNNAFLNVTPQTVTKGGDTSRSSTTTLTNDPDLAFTAIANINYYVFVGLYYDAGAGLIKFDLSLPAGASRNQLPGGLDTSVTASGSGIVRLTRNAQNLGSAGAGTTVGAIYTAQVTMSSTAGAVTFQWAQNSSSGTATIVKAGSWLVAIPQPQ